MTAVAIHTHHGSFPFPLYLLSRVAEEWRRIGIRVDVVAGARPVPSASIGILHVDLTRVPAEYAALREAYPVLLNGAVLDIGKRRLAGLDVGPDDPYAGPVIVKTDLNARGVPERVAGRAARGLPARLAGTLLDHLAPRRPTGRMWHRRDAYPVFRRKSEVPGWVWRRPDLVVQRFVPEEIGSRYARRAWFFLGSRDSTWIQYASDPRFPRERCEDVEPAEPASRELFALREITGFDFGKFDYVLHDGLPVVLDVNKTPGWSGGPATRLHDAVVPALARGLERWL